MLLLRPRFAGPPCSALDRSGPEGHTAQIRRSNSSVSTSRQAKRCHTSSARRSVGRSAVQLGATAIAVLERSRSACPSSSSRAHRAAARWHAPPCVARRRNAAAAAADSAEVDAVASPSRMEAVIIVDHGSRRAESNDMLHQFAELYRYPLHGRPPRSVRAFHLSACIIFLLKREESN